jgi:poly(A) polymerase
MKLLEQARSLALTGKCEGEVQPVTKEEVQALTPKELQVLHEILSGPQVTLALVNLQQMGFFDWLIPEIKESLELKSSKQFKQIWPHTLVVLNQTPAKRAVRWAALFHDLGKAQAFSIKDKKVTFHHHEQISAKIFDKFARKVQIFGRGQKNRIHFLVSNLGYVEGYESNWTDSAVRRFAREVDIYLEDLLTLSQADITTKSAKKKERILRRIGELRTRILEIQEKDAKQPVLPKGLGNEISAQLGVPIGPEIGKIRKELEKKIESGELSPNGESKYYIEYLKKNPVETANSST